MTRGCIFSTPKFGFKIHSCKSATSHHVASHHPTGGLALGCDSHRQWHKWNLRQTRGKRRVGRLWLVQGHESGHGQARLELFGALYWFHRIKMQCHFQRGPATWPSGVPRASSFLSNSGERLCKLMPMHAVVRMLSLWVVVSVADQILWVVDCKLGSEPYASKLPTRFFQGKCGHADSYLEANGDSGHTGTSKCGPERRM